MAFLNYILTLLLVFLTTTHFSGNDAAILTKHNSRPVSKVFTTGRLVSIGSHTGLQHSLHRRDITSVLDNDTHRVGLQLDDGSQPLDMELYAGSVWGPQSVLQARWGRHRLRFHGGDGCYLHGRVTSKMGTATLNRCGRMTGYITTPEHHLVFEELPSKSKGRNRRSLTQTKVKVVKTSNQDDIVVDGVSKTEEPTREAEDDLLQEDNSTETRNEVPQLTIEVALFADAHYMSHLYDLGYDTTQKAQGWFLHKWNTIQDVYNNNKNIGVQARFRLVKMELWWYNPEDYPYAAANESSRLDWFCHNTPMGDGADQKILYTINTGTTRYDSWAKVGKTCVDQQNCYLVKSSNLGVAIELHEMGHSFGLLHDNQMEACHPPQGFMGPGYNYLFKDCYRKALLKRLGTLDCLYRDDFVDKESVPAQPFWMEFV